MLNNSNAYIGELMQKLDFPKGAQAEFAVTLLQIMSDALAAHQFEAILRQYTVSEFCDYSQMLQSVKEIGCRLGIHEYTISLLMYLCLAEQLQKRYAGNGISEELFYNAMMDLRYKLEECRLVYGVNGSFVSHWFYRFFNLTRFALGRLQFEITNMKSDCTIGAYKIMAGAKAINVHIPRSGTKLQHELVVDAYIKAAEFFADEFAGNPIIFTCHSWLLDPWNLTVLAPKSNLATFCRDYKIVETGNYDGYGELWRLFDCKCTDDVSDLPRNSSLRIAYAERVARGEPIAWGRGVFLLQEGKIIN